MKAIWFGAHLYEPLLYLDQEHRRDQPGAAQQGRAAVRRGPKAFHDSTIRAFFEDKELYLLRNLSKGRGVGFFEAGNFHPDFIVWQVEGTEQYVSFVDPKGIRNLGLTDPKIQFVDTIKEIEQRLGDPNVVLSSFIVSNTPAFRMEQQWGISTSGDGRAEHPVSG